MKEWVVSMARWHLPETLWAIECDDSIVLDLINSFQNDTTSRLARLHDAIARLDAATVKAEAHSIRGSARQMGAEALADLCQAVESGAPQRNWPEIECQVNQAEVRFVETCAAMSEYVKGRDR